MRKSNSRDLSVVRKAWVTPRLLRVTLSGDGLSDFPEGRESANCKLIINSEDGSRCVRTYTIRHYRATERELDIDFFIHADHGPASAWALNANPGDAIELKGPGSPKLVNRDCDWVLLAGDMSALPAISANLEQLQSDTRGIVVLEVIDETDRHSLNIPPDMDVKWVFNPNPAVASHLLVDTVKQLQLPAGRGSVWLAGESGAIRALRRYFKEEVGIERSNFYASGYWQIGLSEDAHQLVKRQAADE